MLRALNISYFSQPVIVSFHILIHFLFSRDVKEKPFADVASTVKRMDNALGKEALSNMGSNNSENLRSVQEETVSKDRPEWMQFKNWKKKSSKYI